MISVDSLRRLAAVATRDYLGSGCPGLVSNKLASGFDPVTEADRETEKAIREVINAEFPEHGVLVGAAHASDARNPAPSLAEQFDILAT